MQAEAKETAEQEHRTIRSDMLGLIVPVIVTFFFALILSAFSE